MKVTISTFKFVVKIMNWHLSVHEEQESVSGEVSIVYVDHHLTKYVGQVSSLSGFWRFEDISRRIIYPEQCFLFVQMEVFNKTDM